MLKINDPIFSTVGNEGGVKDVTLTAAQSGLREHNHTQQPHTHNPPIAVVFNGPASSRRRLFATDWDLFGYDANNAVEHSTAMNNPAQAQNASESHTNLMPYKVAYRYKRVS